MKTGLNEANFSGVTAHAAVFSGSTGKKVKFTGADLPKGRFMNNTDMAEADFTGAAFTKASLMDTNFEQADFRGGRFQKAMIQDKYSMGPANGGNPVGND